MSEEYPLYPALSEKAEEQAQHLMDGFKVKMKAIAEEVLGDLYCDVAAYIESDQWTNFRNELLDGLCNYSNGRIYAKYDFKKIRQAILKEYRAEIVEDLNQDLLDEVEELKEHVQSLQGMRRY